MGFSTGIMLVPTWFIGAHAHCAMTGEIIAYILFSSSQIQMVWATAWWGITMMEHIHTLWNWTIGQPIDQTMDRHDRKTPIGRFTDGNTTITMFRASSIPEPAILSFFNIFPKSFLQGTRARSRWRQQPCGATSTNELLGSLITLRPSPLAIGIDALIPRPRWIGDVPSGQPKSIAQQHIPNVVGLSSRIQVVWMYATRSIAMVQYTIAWGNRSFMPGIDETMHGLLDRPTASIFRYGYHAITGAARRTLPNPAGFRFLHAFPYAFLKRPHIWEIAQDADAMTFDKANRYTFKALMRPSGFLRNSSGLSATALTQTDGYVRHGSNLQCWSEGERGSPFGVRGFAHGSDPNASRNCYYNING